MSTEGMSTEGSGAGSTVVEVTGRHVESTYFMGQCLQCLQSWPCEVAKLRGDLDAAQAENDQLRRRTHEIQEAADKRYAELHAELKDWRRWQETLKFADELLTEEHVAYQSAVVRARLTQTLTDLAQAQAGIGELQGEISVIRKVINLWKANWDAFGKDHPEVFEVDRQQASERLAALDAARKTDG